VIVFASHRLAGAVLGAVLLWINLRRSRRSIADLAARTYVVPF